MKTRIQLRKWVLVVLRVILVIDMLFMCFEAQTIKVMLIKSLICILIALPILYLLIKYGGIHEE